MIFMMIKITKMMIMITNMIIVIMIMMIVMPGDHRCAATGEQGLCRQKGVLQSKHLMVVFIMIMISMINDDYYDNDYCE